MSRQTQAKIKLLSAILPDPNRAEKAMFNLLLCSIKLCKKTLARNVINMMIRNSLCTNDVQKCVKTLCQRNNVTFVRRSNKIRKFLMADKLQDTENERRCANREFIKASEEYNKVIDRSSPSHNIFQVVKDFETKKVWEEGKNKNNKKIQHLIRKQRTNNDIKEHRIRNIKFKDEEFKDNNLVGNGNEGDTHIGSKGGNEPRIYGGAEISDEALSILSKDPNYMVLDRVDIESVRTGVEIGLTKARYGWMSDDPEETVVDGNNVVQNSTQRDLDNTLNYANLRATDIPTVQRLYPPKHGTIQQEKILEKLKDDIMKTVAEYKNENCDSKGYFKSNNLSKEENQGIKEIKDKIRNKDIVVFSTDKSGRFSVDTPTNYEEAISVHTAKDIEIDQERVKGIETTINQHMKQFNKMFNVGTTFEQEERVSAATTSTNTPPPPLYGLRKDHKVTNDARKGPPVRPVCGANQAPNSRLSNFLSRIVNDYADKAEIETECRSGEEMKAAFEAYNEKEKAVREQCCVISMDVKALYPSMEWSEIMTAVREMVENSSEEIENVNWYELGKYLAVTMEPEQIEREGLRHVIPMRKTEHETHRKITVAYLCDKNNDHKWGNARSPGHRQRKKMLGIAIAEGVRTCMANHVYCMGDRIYLQSEGGPIGLELTGAVSRPFMARWDRLYLERVQQAGGEMLMYKRYVDDSNQIGKVPPPGARYDPALRKIVVDEDHTDENSQPDERLARVLLDVANDIMECVKMEADWPSRNNDKRLPILDMKVWTDDEGQALYCHYEKPVSSKTVLHSKSAHSPTCKRSVHTQEILRRMLNCSPKLSWDAEAVPAVSEYMRRLHVAGYGERYRENVLKQALSIYDKKWKDHHEGTRPVFRPKGYKKEERKREKEKKKKEWSRKGGGIAPIFIPATPRSELLKRVRKAAEETEKEGIKFTFVEMGGRTIKSELQRSNPTATPGCNLPDCICCREERGKGGQCHRNNVNYEVKCKLCPAVYIGETAKNLYTRMKQHHSNRGEDSFIRKHLEEAHPGVGREGNFTAKVTNTNRDCLSRQVREGVQISQQGSRGNLMNTKSEWHQPSLYRIQSEIVR